MPSRNSAAIHGPVALKPPRSIESATNGAMKIPPSDSPVEAIESANERFTLNHRVTSVVSGTSPVPP